MSVLLRLTFLSMLCALCYQSFAQDEDWYEKTPPIFQGGLTFGANINRVDGDMYDGFHKIGIQAGGIVYVHLKGIFYFSGELLYAQKGARGGNDEESLAIGTYIDKYYLNLNYVEAPLMLHLRFADVVDYEAGISYALLVKTKEWAYADVPVVIDPVLNRFNSTDYNYVVGYTRRISRKNKHWYGSIRYEHSISAIRTWDRVPVRYSQYGVSEYNNEFVIRLLYML